MRRLILGYYISIDGKSVDPDNGMREVMMSIDNDEQEQYFVDGLWDAGAFVMGRKSWQAMRAFGPHPTTRQPKR